MIVSFEQIGLFVQLVGVLLVLGSQVFFGIRAWRKFGGLKKAFFSMVGTVRVGSAMTADEIKKKPEEELKKFPELWSFAKFFREDIWTTAVGLIVTVVGLLLELSSLTLVL